MGGRSVAPIVVGVDDSPSSARAVPLAAREAGFQKRPLCMLHAFNWIPAYPASGGRWSRQAAEQMLGEAERQARALAPDVEILIEIVEGPAVSALLHASRTAALVVVGDGGLADHLLLPADATAVRVAARAECSVMVARETEEITGPVLVGFDGTPGGEQALGYAFDTAAQRSAELIIAYAVEEEPEPGDAGHRRPDRRPDEHIRAIRQWRQKHPDVVVQQHEVIGDPVQVMVREAATAALAVVGARGELPSHGLLGPVSLGVVHHAACPVVVVRGRHERSES